MSRAAASPWKSLGGVMTVTAYSGVILGLLARIAQPSDAPVLAIAFVPLSLAISQFALWPMTMAVRRWWRGEDDGWPPKCPTCDARSLRPIYRVGRKSMRAVGYRCSLCRGRLGIGIDGELVLETPAKRPPAELVPDPVGGEIQFLGEVGPYVPNRANIPGRAVSAPAPTTRSESGPAGTQDDPILLT